MSHRFAHSYEGVKLRNLKPFSKVQIWVDTQFLVTKSCDVKDALYLLHDLLYILFYIEPYIFLCLLFFFLVTHNSPTQKRAHRARQGWELGKWLSLARVELQRDFERSGLFGIFVGRPEDWCFDLYGDDVFGD